MVPQSLLDERKRAEVEELKNWATSDTVHPEDGPRTPELFTKSIAARIPFQFELRLPPLRRRNFPSRSLKSLIKLDTIARELIRKVSLTRSSASAPTSGASRRIAWAA